MTILEYLYLSIQLSLFFLLFLFVSGYDTEKTLQSPFKRRGWNRMGWQSGHKPLKTFTNILLSHYIKKYPPSRLKGGCEPPQRRKRATTTIEEDGSSGCYNIFYIATPPSLERGMEIRGHVRISILMDRRF